MLSNGTPSPHYADDPPQKGDGSWRGIGASLMMAWLALGTGLVLWIFFDWRFALAGAIMSLAGFLCAATQYGMKNPKK